MPRTLPHDKAELGEVAAQGVDQLGPLPDQQVAGAEDDSRALRRRALGRDEAHRRPLRRLADRLRIGHVVLLPLHERLDVSRSDQLGLVAQRTDLARPVVGAGAGLHRHQTARLAGEKGQHLISPQLLADDNAA